MSLTYPEVLERWGNGNPWYFATAAEEDAASLAWFGDECFAPARLCGSIGFENGTDGWPVLDASRWFAMVPSRLKGHVTMVLYGDSRALIAFEPATELTVHRFIYAVLSNLLALFPTPVMR